MQHVREYMIETLILYYEKIYLFLNSRLFCTVQDQNRTDTLVVFPSMLFFVFGEFKLDEKIISALFVDFV